MHSYLINEYWVESAFALPGNPAMPAEQSRMRPPTVRIGTVGFPAEFAQAYWAGRVANGFLRAYDVGDGVLIGASDRVRFYLPRDRREIVAEFDVCDLRERGVACACAINLGMSIRTIFDGGLPLHAASVSLGGILVGVMAPSGTGKSTLLWALIDRGGKFVGDDVLATYETPDGFVSYPSTSLHAKMEKSALEERGLWNAELHEVLPGTDDYWFPIPADERVRPPQPLAALFVLRPMANTKSPEHLLVRRVGGGEAVSVLMGNTQGLWALCGCVDARRVRAQYLAMVRSVPLYAVEYCRSLEGIPGMVRLITEIAAQEVGAAPVAAALLRSGAVSGGIGLRLPFRRDGVAGCGAARPATR